jgi:YfiH family protein
MTEVGHASLAMPRLAEIPGLVHGFGGARLSEADFLAFAASRDMRPVVMRQLHSDIVRRVDAAPAGKLEGDALMTNVPGLLLVVRTADCLPVFLVDEANRAVAAVHCGWRGTEKRILEGAVRAIGEAYGSKPENMLAALGPCIGAGCYEVGPEVREGFLRAGLPPAVFNEEGQAPGERGTRTSGTCPRSLRRPGKSLLDLRTANVWLLESLGFERTNILDPRAACTRCDPSFLSYRRDPSDPRRMYNFIGISPR